MTINTQKASSAAKILAGAREACQEQLEPARPQTSPGSSPGVMSSRDGPPRCPHLHLGARKRGAALTQPRAAGGPESTAPALREHTPCVCEQTRANTANHTPTCSARLHRRPGTTTCVPRCLCPDIASRADTSCDPHTSTRYTRTSQTRPACAGAAQAYKHTRGACPCDQTHADAKMQTCTQTHLAHQYKLTVIHRCMVVTTRHTHSYPRPVLARAQHTGLASADAPRFRVTVPTAPMSTLWPMAGPQPP